MLKKINLGLQILLLVAMLTGSLQSPPSGLSTSDNPPYLEPGLAAQPGELVSVIVTAQSAAAAARAVQQAGGQVTSDLWLIDAVAARLQPGQLDRLADLPGIQSIVANKPVATAGKKPPVTPTPTPTSTPAIKKVTKTAAAPATPTAEATKTSETFSDTSTNKVWVDATEDGWVTDFRFPVPWDGSKDVQTTDRWTNIKLVYPPIIDIGSDHLSGLNGAGITVAVVDSGVYIDALVYLYMGQMAGLQFHGQADFVDSTCATTNLNNRVTSIGVQKVDHCFSNIFYSKDPYGHGTHVAGTIWNHQTESQTGLPVGIAPEAKILSVRVIGPDGSGSYESVIKGIQYVVATKSTYNTRLINLSISATPTTPYFIDPLNRAVENAWAAGIVVVAAAGNDGPKAETISVPGNDPYVITVGAVDGKRTPGYWPDDRIPTWSSSGPTLDGFIKPDLVAPGAQIVSFMQNYSTFDPQKAAALVKLHPDFSQTESLFRMNGTSMAAAVTSGAVAVLLQAHPNLTPDQVKYRLMVSARPVGLTTSGQASNPLQQGAGRLWLPDAVNGVTAEGNGNEGMNLQADLAAGWGTLDANGNPVFDLDQLSRHYLGSVRKSLSDDGMYQLYFVESTDGARTGLGVTGAADNAWLAAEQVAESTTWTMTSLLGESIQLVWTNGAIAWNSAALFDASGRLVWSGGALYPQNDTLIDSSGRLVWSGAELFDASGRLVWSGGRLVWSGGSLAFQSSGAEWTSAELFDSAGRLVWSGGRLVWSGSQLLDASGRLVWSGGNLFDASGRLVWSGGRLVWSGSQLLDASGRLVWSGGRLVWSGGRMVWSGGRLVWSGSQAWTQPNSTSGASISSTRWVDW